jgi:hypothetical protein
LEYIKPRVFDYEPCREQKRTLQYNVGIVEEFLSGMFPSDYADRLHVILEEIPS